MRNRLLCVLAVSATLGCAYGRNALDCVDPLIGTEGSGSEYGGMQPCVCEPFGSFHAVPMTRTNEIGRLSYNASDETLLGIILTRQPAIWMGDWGEVRIPVPSARIERLEATPYLTRVVAGGRTYSFTATAHAAWIRGLDAASLAAFPESGVNTNRMDAKYGYPLPNFGGRWYADKSCPGELKIGLSLISVEQAKANLEREIGVRSFDEVVGGTKRMWEELFDRVEIDADESVRTIFYTGLYHTLLYPRRMDEDGRYYSAFDDRVHEGVRYNCFSLWDTYRAEHPWLTLIAPERVDGMMQSLVDMYSEGGWLPKWPNPSYTGIMVGAPAEIVLQEAMAKGFSGFDRETARAAIRKNATVPQENDTTRVWEDRGLFGRTPETRAGLTSFLQRGYVACDETAESVSRTQDFSLANRDKSYTNLWCAAAGLFLPRRKDGSFLSEDDDGGPYAHYCEQSPATAVWAVPHDPEGLAALMGGNEAAILRLDDYFDRIFFRPDGRGNGSVHGNETSHHCAYLYNRFGAPEKTQLRVRQILTQCYSTDRKGFDGNEDCGQMSAWYLLSALGFYPLDPASGCYELGSPLVRGVRLKLGAATLKITVRNYLPGRWRVRRAAFNGREIADSRIRHEDLCRGGELVYEMETEDSVHNPATDWMPGAVGSFMHWWPEEATTNKWSEFDVQTLKEQLVDAGVDFFVLTLGQNSNYYNAPNDVYEELAGYPKGSRCSPRDIPGEIIAALKGTGIRFGLYSPCQPSFRDAQAEARFGFARREGPDADYDWRATDEGVRNWCKVVRAWSDRYPGEIAFWWFDGAYRFLGYADRHGEEMRAAVRSSNPQAVVTFNDGDTDWGNYDAWNARCREDPHYSENHPFRTWPLGSDGKTPLVQRIGLKACDCNAGETEEPMRFLPDGRWFHDRQYFMLSYLGQWWQRTPCRYPDELWIPWLRDYRARGGCICLDMAPEDIRHDGTRVGVYVPRQVDQLRRLIRATAPGRGRAGVSGAKE